VIFCTIQGKGKTFHMKLPG